jgi:hypothetical protein
MARVNKKDAHIKHLQLSVMQLINERNAWRDHYYELQNQEARVEPTPIKDFFVRLGKAIAAVPLTALVLIPGILIVLVVLGLQKIGEGLNYLVNGMAQTFDEIWDTVTSAI